MPLYAYRCTQCEHRFEKIQNFSAAPEQECPQCQGLLERPLTAPALNFKGAGWYVNDYASSGSKPASSVAPAEAAAPAAAATCPSAATCAAATKCASAATA